MSPQLRPEPDSGVDFPSNRINAVSPPCGSARLDSESLVSERPVIAMPGGAMSQVQQHKILLDESEMPTRWYNVLHDLPTPPPPVLHPGTGQPVGPDDLAPLFPMDLILQEVSTEQYVDIPDEVLDVYRLWRPSPLYPRAPAGEGARHARADLLQVRGRLAGRLAQAEHRRAAGVLQRQGRHQAADHRDRRRPVGHGAGVRLRAVRPGVRGLAGAGVVRPEALPADDDRDVRRHRPPAARRT